MRKTRFCAAMAFVFVSASLVQADAIPINNSSFEMPTQDPGGWTNELPDWDGPPNAGDAFIEYIVDFISDGVNHLGIQNGEEVSQDLGVGLTPNTTYTLTTGVGRRNANFTQAGNESRFGLYAGNDASGGGTLLADAVFDASPLTDLEFVDQSVSFSTGDSVAAGNIVISLRTTGASRAHFDNVRLDAVPVPEPSAILLSVLGLAGLLAVAARRFPI